MCKVRWQFWDAPYISSRLKVCLSDISRISLSVRNRTLPSMDLFYALKPSSREITMGRETRGMPQWIAISTYVPKMQMQIGVRNPIHISLSLSLSLSLSGEDNSIRSARRNEARHMQFDFPVARGIALSRLGGCTLEGISFLSTIHTRPDPLVR